VISPYARHLHQLHHPLFPAPRSLVRPPDQREDRGLGVRWGGALQMMPPGKRISEIDLIFRLLMATSAGAAIGFERR
jgi:hypothetical protein